MTIASARPRLGFLGVGWIGKHRMDAIAASGLAEIAAVADPSDGAIELARSAAPRASVGRSLDDLIAAGVDGVVIATPSGLHASQSLRALEHGLAVFCQKPLARTSFEARRIVDSARDVDRLLGVDLSYRHLAGAQAIRQAVQRGDLGDVFAVDLVFHNAYGPDKSWARDPELAGGGCLIDLGVHLIDFGLWVLDFPPIRAARGRLFAAGRPLARDDSGVEDYAVATIELETGGVLTISCSWNAHAGEDACIKAEFHGTRGDALLRNTAGSFHDFSTELHHGTRRRAVAVDTPGWGGHAAISWVDALRRGAGFDPTAERFVDVAAVLDRIYER